MKHTARGNRLATRRAKGRLTPTLRNAKGKANANAYRVISSAKSKIQNQTVIR